MSRNKRLWSRVARKRLRMLLRVSFVIFLILGIAWTVDKLLEDNLEKELVILEPEKIEIQSTDSSPEQMLEERGPVLEPIPEENEQNSESIPEENESISEQVPEKAEPDGPVLNEDITIREQETTYVMQAQEILDGMTLHEKICQMFIVYPEAITKVSAVVTAGEATQKALQDWPVGGFIYDKKNMQSRDQITDMLTNVQSYSEIPLILTCDEEGGRVNRLMSTVGTTWIGPMLDYKEEGQETAKQNAKIIAGDLVSCGFNMDLAPVADVWSNPDNTVIGDRAYSDDFGQAATLVAAAVEGFHEGGVATTLKHFPGHGDTSADSHYGAVYVNTTLEELRNEEFLPFIAGIEAGTDAVMMGHLIVSDIDDQPALFSYEIVTELLRGELGFGGVVMTDALQMQAMTDYYGCGEIAVKAVEAGVDILLCPTDIEVAVAALTEAVETQQISEERIDESVMRILVMKLERGFFVR